MWKASDLPVFEPQYASALASRFKIDFSPTATPNVLGLSATASPGTTAAVPGPTSPPEPSSDLSTGAKAGIGVGAVIGALVLAAALLFFLRMRKRRGTPLTHNTEAVEAPELVQYYNPMRQSDAMSGTTYTEHISKAPSSPAPMSVSPRQG